MVYKKKYEEKVAPKVVKKAILGDTEGDILLGKRKLIDSKKEKEIIKE